jgi:hypothetical protein
MAPNYFDSALHEPASPVSRSARAPGVERRPHAEDGAERLRPGHVYEVDGTGGEGDPRRPRQGRQARPRTGRDGGAP